MSWMKNVALAVGVAALLAGCKTTVETEVSLSDLLSSPTKQLPARLLVEVSGCASYEDSRQPSKSVLEVQQAIPGIFADAKYEECYRKEFSSFAQFSVPIFLDKDMDGKLASASHINLVSNEKGLLTVGVPEQIRTKIAAAQKRSPAKAFDLKFTIKITNDTGKDVPFTVVAAFIDQAPHVVSKLTSKPGGSFVVALSDVSAKAAIQNGEARVFLGRSE